MNLVETVRSAPLPIRAALLLCIAVAVVDIGSLLVASEFHAKLTPILGWSFGSMFLFAAIGVGVAAGGRPQGRLMVWCIFGIHAASLTWRALTAGPSTGNPYLDVSPLWPWAAFGLPAVVLLLMHLPASNAHLRRSV